MITGDQRAERWLTAFAVGADDVVAEPVDVETLLARIQAKLRQVGRTAARARWLHPQRAGYTGARICSSSALILPNLLRSSTSCSVPSMRAGVIWWEARRPKRQHGDASIAQTGGDGQRAARPHLCSRVKE